MFLFVFLPRIWFLYTSWKWEYTHTQQLERWTSLQKEDMATAVRTEHQVQMGRTAWERYDLKSEKRNFSEDDLTNSSRHTFSCINFADTNLYRARKIRVIALAPITPSKQTLYYSEALANYTMQWLGPLDRRGNGGEGGGGGGGGGGGVGGKAVCRVLGYVGQVTLHF